MFQTYRARGFQCAYWPVELAAWALAIQRQLAPPTGAEVAPLYRWLSAHCAVFAALTEPPAALD